MRRLTSAALHLAIAASVVATALLLSTADPLAGQDTPPSNWSALELERSATCVDALSRLEELDVELAPLAARAQRLLAIAGAINIEESSIVDSLDTADPIETAVREWFLADAELAERYLSEENQAILDERAAGRQRIQETVASALDQVQAQADSVMATTGTLQQDALACGGVIFVKSAALEGCEGVTSRVCTAARDSTVEAPFQFVESPDLLWYREELRPWTTPGPIQLTPQGQLAGASTVGNTRIGNVVVRLSLSPLLRARDELAPEEAATIDSINAAVGIESTHPDVTFVPALAIQATLPHALGAESRYVVHFGLATEPDIIWNADADTGAPLSGTVALAPQHLARLASGDALTLTAVRETADGDDEAVYSVELTSLNQAARVRSLLGYLSQGLSADLERLIPVEDVNP